MAIAEQPQERADSVSRDSGSEQLTGPSICLEGVGVKRLRSAFRVWGLEFRHSSCNRVEMLEAALAVRNTWASNLGNLTGTLSGIPLQLTIARPMWHPTWRTRIDHTLLRPRAI